MQASKSSFPVNPSNIKLINLQTVPHKSRIHIVCRQFPFKTILPKKKQKCIMFSFPRKNYPYLLVVQHHHNPVLKKTGAFRWCVLWPISLVDTSPGQLKCCHLAASLWSWLWWSWWNLPLQTAVKMDKVHKTYKTCTTSDAWNLLKSWDIPTQWCRILSMKCRKYS